MARLQEAPDVWAAIKHAKSHPGREAKAQARWALQAQHLFKPHALELSASAAGSCVLELWAKLHGKLDLPETWDSAILKMDGGTMYGCWLAALFAVGYEDQYDATVSVEVIGEHDGIPAHVEIVIADRTETDVNTKWVVEIKTSFWGGAFDGSRDYHILQAAKEALCANAVGFSIFNALPAATKRGGEKARFFAQDDFVTANYAQAVSLEYRRLAKALDAVAPTADATEPWRCASCRFSACERNKNPLKQATA